MQQIARKPPVLLICVLLALATFIAFEQLRTCQFVNYDDNVYVTNNPHVKAGITSESVIWALATPHGDVGFWHPLTSLSHMLDCQLFGLNASWHHMTSLLFHILNTLLLFLILQMMTGALWPSAFVAAAFALHPLHVESVAWISERKDVLSGFFWMLTIAAYIRYAQRPALGRYLLVVLVFALGLMSKAMLITLPFVLLLLDYWPLGRLEWSDQSKLVDSPRYKSQKISYHKSSPWYLIREKIPLLMLSIVTCVIIFLAQQSHGAVFSLKKISLISRIANASGSYLMYIEKMIWPRGLAVLYPYDLQVFESFAGLLLILIVSVKLVMSRKTHRYLLVGWLWYLGTLLPVIGFVQAGSQAMADRYTYLSSIGIFIIVSFGAAEIASKWRYLNRPIAISALVVLALFMICTRRQVRYWQNSLTLFGHTVEVTEGNHIMHNNYGAELFSKGLFDEAVKHIKEALRINPEYFSAHRNLGRVYLEQNKIEQAVYYWEKALEIEPDSVGIMNSLAWIFATDKSSELRDPKRAVRLSERVCQLTQYSRPDCVNILATAYSAEGRYLKAVENAEKALKLANSAGEIKLSMHIQKKLESYKAKLSNQKPHPTEAE